MSKFLNDVNSAVESDIGNKQSGAEKTDFHSFVDNSGWAEADRSAIAQRNLQERGDLNRGLRSGFQTTAALGGAAVGALMDALGAEGSAKEAFRFYEDRMEAAAQNPGGTGKVEDIGGLGEAADWLQYNVAQQVPNILAMGAGSLATGLLGKTLLKSAVTNAIEKKVASGIALDVTKQQVATRLAQLGTIAGAGGLETGGMWGEDVEKHGLEGSSPIQDIAFGTLSGATEVFSPTGKLATMAGGGRTMTRQAEKGLLKRLGISVPKGMAGEGGQEMTQEFIAMLNEKIQDPDVSLTDKEAISRLLNAGAVGAAVGGVTGPVVSAMERQPISEQITTVNEQLDAVKGKPLAEAVDEMSNMLRREAAGKQPATIGPLQGESVTEFMARTVPVTQDLSLLAAGGETESMRNAEEAAKRLEQNVGVQLGGQPGVDGAGKEQSAAYGRLFDQLDAESNRKSLESNRVAPVSEDNSILASGEQTDVMRRAERQADYEDLFGENAKTILPDKQEAAVTRIERQMAEGEKGYRFKKDDTPTQEGEWSGVKSTNPEWMKTNPVLQKAGKKAIQVTINKKRLGKQLTSREQMLWGEIEKAIEHNAQHDPVTVSAAEYDRIQNEEGIQLEAPHKIPVGNLDVGDKVVVQDKNGVPDVVEHQGYDENGQAILQDGIRMHADPWDTVEALGVKKSGKTTPIQTEPNIPTGESAQSAVEDQIGENAADAKFSESKGGASAVIEEELAKSIGKAASNKALQDVTILETQEEALAMVGRAGSEADGKIEGFTTPDGKIYLVRDGISEGKVKATLIHEKGHRDLPSLYGEKGWGGIVSNFEKLSKGDNPTGAAIRAAAKRVPGETNQKDIPEERVMYFLADKANVKLPLYRKIFAYIKDFFAKKWGGLASFMTPDDLVAIMQRRVESGAKPAGTPDKQSMSMAADISEALGKPEQIATLEQMGITGEDAQLKQIVRDAVSQKLDIAIAMARKGKAEKAYSFLAEAKANAGKIEEMAGEGTISDLSGEIDRIQEAENTIKFSIATAEEFDNTVSEVGSGLKDNDDAKWYQPFYKTFEYLSQQTKATSAIFKLGAEARRDAKVANENFGLDGIVENDPHFEGKKANGFVAFLERLKKKDKDLYGKFKDYLLDTDKSGKSFRIKAREGHGVYDPQTGERVAFEKNLESARVAANNHNKMHHKGEGILSADYIIDEKPVMMYDVENPQKEVLSTHENEKEAVASMIEEEIKSLGDVPADMKDAVRKFREMTNRAFDMMVDDYRRIVKEAKDLGLQEPAIEVPDESKRYVIVDSDGKKIKDAYFETKKEAEDKLAAIAKVGVTTEKAKKLGMKSSNYLKYKNAQIRRQSDNEIRMPVTLSTYIAMMGDLRGSYFPRQRQRGAYVLKGVHPDGRKFRQHYDLAIDPKTAEAFEAGKMADAIKILKGAEKIGKKGLSYVVPILKEYKRLEKEGFRPEISRDTGMPESIFEATKLIASMDAMLQAGTPDKPAGDKAMQSAFDELTKMMAANVADIVKRRGYLSSRMRRAESYWEGFETDPLKAGVQYIKGLSAGLAKKESARKITLALTGRLTSWGDFKEQNPDATYADYREFVNSERLDPKKYPQLYKETMSWTKEMLRNDEQMDRIIGTLKGLAVLKFLGGRVSSAAVNLTNMVQAVPATLSAHSGAGLTESFKQIGKAASAYYDYRRGKASTEDKEIFQYISEKGWDVPQFNHDAAAVLRSKAGAALEKVSDVAMYMFGEAEKINRATTIYAAYKMHKAANPDADIDSTMEMAKHTSDRAHGIYGKETAPVWTRGSSNLLKLTWVFQKFAQNYMLNMGEMWSNRNRKEFMYMLLAPGMLAGAGASLATKAVAGVFNALGADDSEEDFYRWAEETFGSDRLARHGIAGLFNVNLKGSIQINTPMPTSIMELLGAPGALVTDMVDAYDYYRRGDVMKGAEKTLPTAIGSVVKAVREYSQGVTTGLNTPVYWGDEPLKGTATDAVLRFFSFNPARLSGIREKQWKEKRVASRYNEWRSDIYAKLKRHTIKGNGYVTAGEWMEIMREVEKFNEEVIGANVPGLNPITKKTLKNVQKRSMTAPKRERERFASTS